MRACAATTNAVHVDAHCSGEREQATRRDASPHGEGGLPRHVAPSNWTTPVGSRLKTRARQLAGADAAERTGAAPRTPTAAGTITTRPFAEELQMHALARDQRSVRARRVNRGTGWYSGPRPIGVGASASVSSTVSRSLRWLRGRRRRLRRQRRRAGGVADDRYSAGTAVSADDPHRRRTGCRETDEDRSRSSSRTAPTSRSSSTAPARTAAST